MVDQKLNYKTDFPSFGSRTSLLNAIKSFRMISSKVALVGILIFLTCSSANPVAKEKKVSFTLHCFVVRLTTFCNISGQEGGRKRWEEGGTKRCEEEGRDGRREGGGDTKR